MIHRHLWIGMLLLGAVLLAACESSTPATPSPTPIPVPPTVAIPATAPPLAATATTLPPSATPVPPTDTPVPPSATATAVTLAFPLALDEARLAALYAQAQERATAAAADAQLSRVRLELIAYGLPALVRFTFYAPGTNTIYEARATDGGDISTLDKSPAPNQPPAVFTPAWVPNAGWAASVAARLAAAGRMPDPAHGRWRFVLEAVPGGPDWQVSLAVNFAYTLAADKVAETPLLPDQPPGTPVAVPEGDDLPFGYILNNTAIDRYYRAALRLGQPQASDLALRAVDLRFGDPADADQATILYHLYSAAQKKGYLGTFDTGGRREVVPEPLPAGASKTTYRESTLPWKVAPAWPGLVQVAAAPLAGQPTERVRMLVSARADQPATWTMTATLVVGTP